MYYLRDILCNKFELNNYLHLRETHLAKIWKKLLELNKAYEEKLIRNP